MSYHFKQKRIVLVIVFAAFLVLMPGTGLSQDTTPVDEFWASLQKLCGNAYAGSAVAVPGADTTFRDKQLVIDVYSCQERKIKITVLVGNDRSRTWVIYQSGDRMLLKHQHRLENGTLDRITNYGGWTSNPGSATRQMFSADTETAAVIPEAATNVWWIDLVPGKTLTYHLQRIGTDRYYSLNFDLSKAIPVPELLDN